MFILRYHPKPPNYEAHLFHTALSLLPWALVGHLAFSAWMYGNNDILESKVINPAIIDGWTPGGAEGMERICARCVYRAALRVLHLSVRVLVSMSCRGARTV